ncbi:MAG: Uma2 family endonuclease [Arcicella sp.]|jgi:Uma2 family endonuclease|nr:Uma2 family endonuclease [Arcicella sp.]
MLDIPVNMGVNAPREHQRVITKLSAHLYWLFDKGEIPFEPLVEAMVNESESSPTPDVMLLDNVLDELKVIVEVTSTGGVKKDFNKIAELMLDYDIDEGFIYDYKKGNWRKYKNGVGEILEKPSFCDTIGYDLNDFVK